jgi:hypothetical protein
MPLLGRCLEFVPGMDFFQKAFTHLLEKRFLKGWRVLHTQDRPDLRVTGNSG